MHPAYSVIFFTTASGAGYGMLALLGGLGAAGLLPVTPATGIAGLGGGLALVTAGLLSSTAHLGRPGRAWRALSQWRSSWLSREGIAAIVSFMPALVLGYAWVVEGRLGAMGALAGIALAVAAVLTVYCTAMIYRSLAPIHQWATGWTVAGYLMLALSSGAVVLDAALRVTGAGQPWFSLAAAIACLGGLAVKLGYWHYIDTTQHAATPESATALSGRGRVRHLEGPHSAPNYLMKEMGYVVARRHTASLRRIAVVAGFVGPAAAMTACAAVGGTHALVLSLAATIAMGMGLIVERWLFFAEARHTVTLYYGADAA